MYRGAIVLDQLENEDWALDYYQFQKLCYKKSQTEIIKCVTIGNNLHPPHNKWKSMFKYFKKLKIAITRSHDS